MGINETLATFFKSLSNHAGPAKVNNNGNNNRRTSKGKLPPVTFAIESTASGGLAAATKARQPAVAQEKRSPKKKQKRRLRLEKTLMKNFVGVASNSSNALGAFLYGSDLVPGSTDGTGQRKKYRTTRVDTAFIPSQTAGKYVVKVTPNNPDGTVSAPFNSVASDAAAAAAAADSDKENPSAASTAQLQPREHQRQLIGWLQMIHVDKRIVRQKSALLKDLFAHIEKTLGHLFAAVSYTHLTLPTKRIV